MGAQKQAQLETQRQAQLDAQKEAERVSHRHEGERQWNGEVRQTGRQRDSHERKRSSADTVAEHTSTMLVVRSLPADITDSMLAALFGQIPGFKECKMAANKSMAVVGYA